ncbi:MAG TPA: VOC family protein [Polyangiaceae bacterium]
MSKDANDLGGVTGGYLHTEGLEIPVPQAWLEFDVDDVERATTALAARGYRMLVKNRKEPWGQIVSRLLSPEGLLLGITFTPSMREKGA